MSTWSARKKISYISGIVIFFVVLIASLTTAVVYKPASCFDGKQNQGEFGVDCGGPCQVLCKNQSTDPIVHWQKSFQVTDGYYNSVAYVENPNPSSSIDSASYVFKIYDSNNLLIAERAGKTFIPPKKLFAVFEPLISTGNRIPARTAFAFEDLPPWKDYKAVEPGLVISNQNLSQDSGEPILTAEVSNPTFATISNFDVVAIIYDSSGNAGAVSRTVVDRIGPNESEAITFSWPRGFDFTPARIEIAPKIYPSINY